MLKQQKYNREFDNARIAFNKGEISLEELVEKHDELSKIENK